MAFAQFFLAHSPFFPHFNLHPRCPLWEESDLPYVFLCCFACCQTGNGPWHADSWLSCCPPWLAVICCTVSHSHRGSQSGLLTVYFGLKLKHPSVTPNKHYLKGDICKIIKRKQKNPQTWLYFFVPSRFKNISFSDPFRFSVASYVTCEVLPASPAWPWPWPLSAAHSHYTR